jgi:hypothetical protein
VHGSNSAHGFGLSARWPVGRCGLMPEGAAQQQLGPTGSAAHRARAVTAAGNDAVAQAATTHQRLRCCGIGGEGMKVVGEVHWARRSEAGLTQIAARWWGSGAARRGGGRRQ